MDEAPRKTVRVVENDGDRIISDLPEEVICDILSCLPIKEAVRTSVLSRNWGDKWTFMYDINIDDKCKSLCGKHNYVEIFVNMVDRILFSTHNFRSFRLSCDKAYRSRYLRTWISEVSRRRVQSLVIDAPRVRYLVLSPSYLEGCTSLTELKLFLHRCTLTLPTQNRLLNLKSLSLGDRIEILNQQSAYSGQGQVILNFPVLEVLELRRCKWLDVITVEIRAPNLIRFNAFCIRRLNIDYSIKICGPKLATYESSYGSIDNFVLNAPAVTSAALNHNVHSKTIALRVHMVLKGFPDLKCLKLSGDVVEALAQAKSGQVTPTFYALKQLELYYGCRTEDLLEFLKVVPFLESLNLNLNMYTRGWDDYDYENQGEANLPPCISSCIKEVKFLRFREQTGQVDLAKFILKNAENLQSVIVSGHVWTKSEMNRLSSTLIPKSPTCVVKLEKET